MSNPQQPELRRSEQVPALSPDAMESELEARRANDALADSPEGLDQPDDRRDDEHEDQDQPDQDRFAEQFGVVDDESA